LVTFLRKLINSKKIGHFEVKVLNVDSLPDISGLDAILKAITFGDLKIKV